MFVFRKKKMATEDAFRNVTKAAGKNFPAYVIHFVFSNGNKMDGPYNIKSAS